MSQIRRAYEEGRAAFLSGEPNRSPYLRYLPEDEAWRAGWEDASGRLSEAHFEPPASDSDQQWDLWERASPL